VLLVFAVTGHSDGDDYERVLKFVAAGFGGAIAFVRASN
jgi:hypothetical protein